MGEERAFLEQKGEGGDRADLVEKKEDPKGREQSSQ